MDKVILFVQLFFIYGFIGWLCEVLFGIYQHGRFINRGFLIGPICPIDYPPLPRLPKLMLWPR